MPKKKSKNYFTQETEDAIILYNNTENPHHRSKIYEKHIHYPFFKLTQNIIHTFKFYHTDIEELTDLQHEIIVFLLSKIHLYNHTNNIQKRIDKIITKEFKCEYKGDFAEYVDHADKVTQEQIHGFIDSLTITPINKMCGSCSEYCNSCENENEDIINNCLEKLRKITPPKAYSYFGTIVKRWLIIYNEKNYSNKVNNSSVEDLYHDSNYSYLLDDNKPQIEDLSQFIDSFTEYITENIYNLFPNGDSAQVADSILELFRKRKDIDDIEKFTKKTSYLYIREIYPKVQTTKITKVANNLKTIFQKNYTFFLENGYVDFETLK
jgi:hypothetical protein